MYDYFAGEIVEKGPTHAVVEVAGVGYRLTMTPRCVTNLPDAGRAKVFAHLHVREDDQRLYGFSSRPERAAFECLLGASGVGPSLALQILTHLSPAELRRAVLGEDVRRISAARGVGQKTARKIVLDLKSRLEKRLDLLEDEPASAGASAPGAPRFDAGLPVDQALRALMALGYTEASAESALRKVLETTTDAASNVELLVRLALKAG